MSDEARDRFEIPKEIRSMAEASFEQARKTFEKFVASAQGAAGSLTGPADLRALAPDQLPALAAEIRDALVTSVAKTGGHLGPNLGAVELTIAVHRVFDSPL